MNILIPHSWLLEHLDIQASPQEIQRLVSLSGPSIERIYDREGEPVYDIEVTTNRVDSMSVRGIARECAVILNQAGVSAKLKNLEIQSVEKSDSLPLPEVVNDPKLCKRVLCVILKDVKHAATPDWMAKRLIQTEMNVHDAVIDITNYVTHELGHPCHAFDYDKVMSFGGKIIVKEADAGKKFRTLDDAEYTTVGGEVVFENEQGEIIDFPAIKGTANTAVDDNTHNVLFWIESLDPKKIRFGSMTHAIRTVAAQLNEKDVDPELAMDVLKKGVELYVNLCGATVASDIYDQYPQKQIVQPVTVQKSVIDTYLGIDLDNSVVVDILKDLGCEVSQEHDSFTVQPPSFRPDLEIPADIVEEVARIYGYHNLPSVLMDGPIPLVKQEGVNLDLEKKIKQFLANIGWQEVYTYSMVSEALALKSGWPLDEHLKLQNPLTDDKVYLRNSLIPSLHEVIEQNAMEKELSVFEVANVYWIPQQATQVNVPNEVMTLGMVSRKSFRHVKGDLESLLAHLHISITAQELNDPQIDNIAQSSIIKTRLGDQEVQLGTVAVLKDGLTAIQLGLTNLDKVVRSHPTYQAIPQTAQIIEDLTFTLAERTAIGPIISAIKKSTSLIAKVELKDMYKHNATFSITYLDPTQNLSTQDVEPVRKSIVQLLEKQFHTTLVGNLS